VHKRPLIVNMVHMKVGRPPEVDRIELPAQRTVIDDSFYGLAYLGNPVPLLEDPADCRREV
jgi:hypothetical protein